MVGRTCLQCRGRGFNPWSGNQHPTCHVVWPKQLSTFFKTTTQTRSGEEQGSHAKAALRDTEGVSRDESAMLSMEIGQSWKEEQVSHRAFPECGPARPDQRGRKAWCSQAPGRADPSLCWGLGLWPEAE